MEDKPQLDRGRGRHDFERSAVARPAVCQTEKGLQDRHGVPKKANDDSEPAGIKATRHVTASAALVVIPISIQSEKWSTSLAPAL